MLNNMMENEHKSFTNTSIFSGNMLPSSFKPSYQKGDQTVIYPLFCLLL